MLRFLSIRRLALLDAVEVEFEPGLNVLTGETGAGKSILVEAVGLLLGGRAAGELVRSGEETATVEAIFENGGEELVVRREVTAQGRSRAFVNDALVTVTALRERSAQLIELHGQHEHQTLLDPATHLKLLDGFGKLTVKVDEVAAAFDALQRAGGELARVRMAMQQRDTRLELVTFQLAELERATLTGGNEDAELASVRDVLASADRVQRLCAESYAALYESDEAVLSSLGSVWRRVGELADLDPQFRPYVDARDEIKSQLEDLALFLRRYGDTIDASPGRLQQVEERLALLERLKRKHGPSLSDVIARRDALRQELAELNAGDERIGALEQAHADARERYLTLAGALGAERRAVARTFSRAVERELADLAMERTRFEVVFRSEPLAEGEWSARGIDEAEFYLSPNPGEELRPLARIVSGGELSRVMLAIKTLTVASRGGTDEARQPSGAAPGLIFDEVDAGIGGRVADVVGRKLRTVGSAFQVLCITHLPQIASYADTHFHIAKDVSGGRTRTTVSRLDGAARVEEIARMMGGEDVTDRIRASAREMITERSARPARGAKGESKSKGESESLRSRGRTPRPGT